MNWACRPRSTRAWLYGCRMLRFRWNANLCLAGLVAALMLGAVPAGRAEPVEEFYKGKQLRIIIRAGPGGNYDLYSRLLVRHLVRYIPGRPTALPENMPGGSGLT